MHGLREQKRAATRLAIELAVLELTLEHGLAQVTVDEVSRVAQVSPRTFFNYFASKEDALSGGNEPFSAPDEAVAEFIEGDNDLLTGLVTLIAASLVGRDTDAGVHRLRREVFRRNPELLGLRVANAKQTESEVAGIAERRIRQAEAHLGTGLTDDEIADRAGLVALVAFGIVRHGWMRWAALDGRTPLSDCVLNALREFIDTCSPFRTLTSESVPAAV